ncbi:TRAP transporter small permease [Sporosarcina sp. PTS2304]|uniref:TRAP transporter small permease n=1 Tax=Sporosarcina sp. PTS2304 TaxID=2283194 RepID=UPI0013B41B44|nr:TRAP transporter small permease [Sporosarcina sp. PTS2304]
MSSFLFTNEGVVKMITTYKWLDRNFEPILIAILFYVMTTIVTVQVILRFVFNSGFSWAEELARFLFVWLMYFSISYATRNNAHIRITFLVDKLNEKAVKVMAVIVDLLFILFAVVIFISAWKICQSVAEFQDKAVTLNVSMNILYGAGFIGFGLMIIRLVQGLIWKVKNFAGPMDRFANEGGLYTGGNEVAFSPKEQLEDNGGQKS